jgi:hypothetical protein
MHRLCDERAVATLADPWLGELRVSCGCRVRWFNPGYFFGTTHLEHGFEWLLLDIVYTPDIYKYNTRELFSIGSRV